MRRALALALVALAACGGGDADHGHAHHDHAGHDERDELGSEASRDTAHAHVAPHGGLLIALGAEAAHVELLLDATQGELGAWLLDGEAERALKSGQEALVVHLSAGTFRLEPVASALTGETVGDTSQFRARSPELVGATLEGSIERVEVLGTTFSDVAIVPEQREDP